MKSVIGGGPGRCGSTQRQPIRNESQQQRLRSNTKLLRRSSDPEGKESHGGLQSEALKPPQVNGVHGQGASTGARVGKCTCDKSHGA